LGNLKTNAKANYKKFVNKLQQILTLVY